jgi:hypothetical protein
LDRNHQLQTSRDFDVLCEKLKDWRERVTERLSYGKFEGIPISIWSAGQSAMMG